MKLVGKSVKMIDETYQLPQGKVSTYRNHANEQTLQFSNEGQKLDVLFRVYNDGVAFSFVMPGDGEIEMIEESSAINLAGANFTYYGQNHPNKYGYESALGPIDGERMSNAVLAHLKDQDHFVLMAQAATNGQYVQCHFQRTGSSFRYSFPIDQPRIGPVVATLPFQSPWRAVVPTQNPSRPAVERAEQQTGFRKGCPQVSGSPVKRKDSWPEAHRCASGHFIGNGPFKAQGGLSLNPNRKRVSEGDFEFALAYAN
jgi:hypothetical protein